MAAYYYATITYHSGDKVRLVHEGTEPTEATMALLGRIGASIEVQERLAPVEEGKYQESEAAHDKACRAGWHPQMDVPGDDDD